MKLRIIIPIIFLLTLAAMSQEVKILREFRHYGMCDASAAVALSPNTFAVANDEDNFIRVYRSDSSGAYLAALDVSGYMKEELALKESDLEGAAMIDESIFWITSHGRNKKGKHREARHHFFANRIHLENGQYTHRQIDSAYTGLLEDILSDLRYSQYGLEEAAKLAPKDSGGLNIEGLAATPDKRLLIGFRNPVPAEKALLVPLENPFEVLRGEKAILGDPMELPLGNLGIRSIAYWPARGFYLIVGGPHHSDSGENFRLFRWSGDPARTPAPVEGIDLKGFNIEAVVIYPDKADRVQLLSDDGALKRGKKQCKKLPDNSREKYFRSIWVEL